AGIRQNGDHDGRHAADSVCLSVSAAVFRERHDARRGQELTGAGARKWLAITPVLAGHPVYQYNIFRHLQGGVSNSMNRKRKWLVSLLAVVMLAGLIAGCGGGKNDGGKTASPDNGSAGSGDSGGDELKPITFTFYSADPSPNWQNMQDAVGRAITAATGVTLD